MSGEKEEN